MVSLFSTISMSKANAKAFQRLRQLFYSCRLPAFLQPIAAKSKVFIDAGDDDAAKCSIFIKKT